FAERISVLYVEPRTYLRETVRGLLAGRFPWRDIWRERVTPVRPNLYVYHNPPYAPISGRFPLRELTAGLRRFSLRRQMRRLGMARPILWLCRPEMGDLIGQWGEKLVLYHVVDEYSAYEGVADREEVRRRERELLQRVDLVITTAPALYESKRPFNPHTYLVPNAVNYELFAEVIRRDAPEPADLAGLPRPRIGYVGAVNAKLDMGYFGAIAGAYPSASIVIVGPVSIPAEDERLRRLRAMPNVHFLGQKPAEQVPCYIKAIDVCLLPYRQNEWTRHISSLKLYEYMACEKPIVASDVPAARQFAELVYIVGTPAEAVPAVGQALQGHPEGIRRRQRQVAQENTWRRRAEMISDLIAGVLEEKRRRA
ncbi:MAG: glycosyltransferase, partial [Anaerolineae bacterium]